MHNKVAMIKPYSLLLGVAIGYWAIIRRLVTWARWMRLCKVLESIWLHKIEVALASIISHVIENDMKDTYRKELTKAG